MTFDRLAPNRDLSDVTTVYMTSTGLLQVRAMQPCFTAGPSTGDLADYCEAPSSAVLADVELWSLERRSYVLDRWRYWAAEHRSRRNGPRSMQTGE
jgi:hypothetical protein